MSPRFLAMIPFLWEWEGTKFENDPDDPGGATKFGIDQRSHPGVNIRELTEESAKQIYWDSYWQRCSCETYDYPLGEVVFNCAVNAGFGRARSILGDLGAKADASVFLNAQDAFYRRLVAARPRSQKFLKGWLNRTRALRTHLGLPAAK